jgi:V-type H+-transporting ATPase subunit H
MVDAGLLKICDTLLKGNIKDKETVEDITYVGEILEKNIKILT